MADPLELWSEDRQQLLEDATVHLVCAPEELELVRAWVERQPSAQLYRVTTSLFVPAGTVLGWQGDGVLAPSTVQPVMRRG